MPPFNPYAKKSSTFHASSVGSFIEKKDSEKTRLNAQKSQPLIPSKECQNGHKITMPSQPTDKTLSRNDTPSCKNPNTLLPKPESNASVTPSPTLKVPLKQQLKYEIAMLKKQKKDRIMAKQSATQPVTQHQQSESKFSQAEDQRSRNNIHSDGSHPRIVAGENKIFAPIPISLNTKLDTVKDANVHNHQNNSMIKDIYPMKVPMYFPPQATQIRQPVTPVYQPSHPVPHNALYPGALTLHHHQMSTYPLAPMHFQSSYKILNSNQNNAPIPSISKLPSMILHKDPLQKSFFGKTHCFLKTQIAVVKKEGESFGVNLKYETKINAKTKETCGVLMVTNANIQNLRAKPGTIQTNLLQKGDIIISINSKQTFGLEFREATSLFAKCKPIHMSNTSSDSSNTNQYICNLTIARDKKRAKVLALLENLSLDATKSLSIKGAFGPAPPKVPFIVNEATGKIHPDSDFNSKELNALITGYVEYEGKTNEDVFSDILLRPIGMRDLRQRTVIDCIKKWDHMSRMLEFEMSSAAITHWKSIWKEDAQGIEQNHLERDFISDSERSFLRRRPRPAEGCCKCGSKEHKFVNHPGCFLYRNLKESMDASTAPTDEIVTKSSNRIAKYDALLKDKTLNSIGNAHLQRIRNQLEEQEAERNEAIFVNRMEHIQVKRGIAVFSPKYKSVMVLSAIASCQEKFFTLSRNNENLTEQRRTRDQEGYEDSDDDDSDEDDDIPLNAALGKRSATSINAFERKNKTARSTRKVVNLVMLGSILEHLSITWGHLFMDLDPVEEAW